MTIVVNKHGTPELELLVNELYITRRYRDEIIQTLFNAGFSTVADVCNCSIPEMICKCPTIREVIPPIHKYAETLMNLGWVA